MPVISDLSVHIHLHSHETVADFDGVKALAQRSENPFHVFMPEMPPESTHWVQAISDGDEERLARLQQQDDEHKVDGLSTNDMFARGRAIGETVFNTGLTIASPHPLTTNTITLHERNLANGTPTSATLDEAARVAKASLSAIIQIIKARDSFAAHHFRIVAQQAVNKNSNLWLTNPVNCLLEIGSLHFRLPELLSEKGETVEVSGDTDESNSPSYCTRVLTSWLQGNRPEQIDYRRIALENAIGNMFLADTSATKNAVVAEIIDSEPRKRWPKLYRGAIDQLTPA